MDPLSIEVIGGIAAGVILGVCGYYVRKLMEDGGPVLPGEFRPGRKDAYSHLNGSWHQYYVTYYGPQKESPLWLHGVQEIEVKNGRVKGKTTLIDHPDSDLRYLLRGEIRSGNLIITDSCVEEEAEFASIIFADLRSKKTLVGIWVGFDNYWRLIAGPVVWSRDRMNGEELNMIVKRDQMHLVRIDLDYDLFIPPS